MAAKQVSSSRHEHDPLLQARVRLVLDVFLGLLLVFLAFTAAEELLVGTEIGAIGITLHILSVVFLVVARALVGRAPRSVRFVRVVDVAVLVVMGIAIAGMASDIPIGYRPELTLLLVYAVIIFGRTALVPSTVRETVLVCIAYALLLGVVSWRTYLGHESPGPEYPEQTALGVTIFIELWWLVISVIAAFVSRLIYGLRREVFEAQQLGQYTLEAKLGAGGMGEVYRARHAMLRRPTAVKLVPPDRLTAKALARFEREVQLTAELTHPNTVTVFDYGRTDDGVFYYAMELLEGGTLREVVAADGPQPPERVIRILSQIADALAEAHGVGLIHRDIKPENIMLTRQGRDPDFAKVLDFGLVREIRPATDAALTEQDAIQGTPLYMAPEMLSEPDRAEPHSDLYALGAVGYYLLTAEDVFTGATIVEVCAQHLHATPTPPSARLGRPVHPQLEEVILACLAKDPSERPSDASALARMLLECDCADRWTPDRAKEWWRVHGPRLESRRQTESISGDKTLVAADRPGLQSRIDGL